MPLDKHTSPANFYQSSTRQKEQEEDHTPPNQSESHLGCQIGSQPLKYQIKKTKQNKNNIKEKTESLSSPYN